MERWEGARSGMQAALDVFNADEVKLTCTWSAIIRLPHCRLEILNTSFSLYEI